MKTIHILNDAKIEDVPRGTLGGQRRVVNRKILAQKIAVHRKLLAGGTLVLFIVLACSLFGAIYFASTQTSMPRGTWPYIGGTAFMGLLAAGMKLIKGYGETDLPLLMLEHADDDLLAGYIESVLKTSKRARAS